MIRDLKVAKKIQDEDKFRIVLERILPTEKKNHAHVPE